MKFVLVFALLFFGMMTMSLGGMLIFIPDGSHLNTHFLARFELISGFLMIVCSAAYISWYKP